MTCDCHSRIRCRRQLLGEERGERREERGREKEPIRFRVCARPADACTLCYGDAKLWLTVADSGWQWQAALLNGTGGRVANAMHPSSWHGNIVSLHSIEQTPTSLNHPTTCATSLGVPYVSSQSDSDPSPWPGRWRGLAVALIPATRAASTALSPDHGSISPGILRHQSPRPPLGIGPPARPPPVE